MGKYQKYKPTDLKLISEIPEHWEKTKLKYIGFLYGGLTGKNGEDFKKENDPNNKPFINFTNICNNTYISKDNFGIVSILDDENQNRVRQGDLFFLMSSETQEDIGKTSVLKEDIGEVYLNSFCKGFRIRTEKLDPYFTNYLLSGNNYRQLMSVNGKGFTRVNLRQDKVNDFLIYYPPLPEQNQIVNFLDQKTSIIDSLIQKKLRKIELLKEQRTTLINNTVTKGLNPDVKMKDSGVEWIGEIPEHWDKKKITYCFQKIGSGTTPTSGQNEYYENGEFNWLQTGDLNDGEILVTSKKITKLALKDYTTLRFYPIDSIVIAMYGATIGKLGILKIESTTNQACCVLSNPQGVDVRFIYYWFISNKKDIISLSYGGGQPNINQDIIRNLRLQIPKMDEQQQIVQYLDQKTTEIDTTITLEHKKIDLLKEYRQSLISEVVTGKIDVRQN